MFTRFSALPVNYYGECLHRLQIESGETCLGDLADDLADIWRDVKRGLEVFDAGDIEGATIEWHQASRSTGANMPLVRCISCSIGSGGMPVGGRRDACDGASIFPGKG